MVRCQMVSLVVAAPLVSAVQSSQPAYDLLERTVGKEAIQQFNLTLLGSDTKCSEDVASPCFALSDQTNGTIAIRGSGMSELTYGLGYYLRFWANLTVGWPRGGGSHTTPPESWPKVGKAVAVARQTPWTYQDNVCTHSYSYVWYDEAAWIQHIDWMALHGINVFLAITGQEEIQYKVFQEFGVSDTAIRSWFNSPAWLTWSRGQSMQSVGAKQQLMPRSWMQAQWNLQQRILARTRPLGIIGVLPAFQGNMPPQMKTLFPSANISVTSQVDIDPNVTDGQCAWVTSTDPLFGKVADRWMETLVQDFGTDHWYQCDGFFTGADPPWLSETDPNAALNADPEAASWELEPCTWSDEIQQTYLAGCSLDCKSFGDLDEAKQACEAEDTCSGLTSQANGQGPYQMRAGGAASSTSGEASWQITNAMDCRPVQPDPAWTPVWKGAFEGMARTDPEAKWLYQGWAIRGWSDRAGAARLRALYEAVPKGQWIPLDMDTDGIWRYFSNYSFFGAPFIWSVMHNQGGADFLKGDMVRLQKLPADAIAAGASVAGVGVAAEGIDQNPIFYEYVYDSAWKTEPTDLQAWFRSYALQRYGSQASDAALQAWELLRTTVYETPSDFPWHDNTGVEWNPVSSFAWHQNPPPPVTVDVQQLFQIWSLLTRAAADAGTPRATLNYDLVNAGREVMAQLSTWAVLNLTAAVDAGDRERALQAGSDLMEIYADLDELLGCESAFLLGPWIAAAKEWSNSSDAPESYYEWQARAQVSTWNPVSEAEAKLPDTYTHSTGLDDYAAKHWQGLVKDFYAARAKAYIDQVAINLPGPLDTVNMTKAVVTAEVAFNLDTSASYPTEPVGRAVDVSQRLLAKYSKHASVQEIQV